MLKNFDEFLDACENNIVTIVAREYSVNNKDSVTATHNCRVTSNPDLVNEDIHLLGEVPVNHNSNVFVWDHSDALGRSVSMQAIDWHIE